MSPLTPFTAPLHPRYPAAVQALYDDPNATFRSPEQAALTHHLFEVKDHVLAILPTGAGKSLAMMLPSKVEKSGITAVIVPFVALLQDLRRRFTELKIPFCEWRGKRSVTNVTLRNSRIVLVQVENAATTEFSDWITGQCAHGHLSRIIIDEAHTALIDFGWRKPLDLVAQVRAAAGVPVVLLTATLAPFSERALFDRLYLPDTTHVIRAPSTARPNIRYRLTEISDTDIVKTVIHAVRKVELKDGERGIIFCRTTASAECFGTRLDIPIYIGPMSEQEKAASFSEWKRWLSATSAFGFGTDYPSVRHIIVVECPYDMVSFVQMTGRAGRDGKPAIAEMFYSDPPDFDASKVDASDDHAGKLAMHRYITKPLPCRRTPISKFCDGSLLTCSAIPNALLCDLCSKRAVSSAQKYIKSLHYIDSKL